MASNVRKRRSRKQPKRELAPLPAVVPIPYPSDACWDRMLNSDELRQLAWEDKERHVLESLRRKVAIVIEYADNPSRIAAGSQIPRGRKALREWTDPSIGLWPWKWPALDNPDHPKNGKLIELFWAALDHIDASSRDNNASIQKEVRDRDATIAQQKQQIAELMAEIIDLRKRAYGR